MSFVKPNIAQVRWVLQHLADHLEQHGTFRDLVIDRFGFGMESYHELMASGGVQISNILELASTLSEFVEGEGLSVEFTAESDRDPDPESN